MVSRSAADLGAVEALMSIGQSEVPVSVLDVIGDSLWSMGQRYTGISRPDKVDRQLVAKLVDVQQILHPSRSALHPQ